MGMDVHERAWCARAMQGFWSSTHACLHPMQAQVTDLGVARDTPGHLEGCLQAAIDKGVDVLVTSGGCSRMAGLVGTDAWTRPPRLTKT